MTRNHFLIGYRPMLQANTGRLAGAGGVISQVTLQRGVRVFVVHGLSLELRFGRGDLLNSGTYKSWDEPMMRLLHLLDQSQASKAP